MPWVKVDYTFDGDWQRITERRSACFHAHDVLMDRLLHDFLPNVPSFCGSFHEGSALFQALLEAGNDGEYKDATVIAWGFDIDRCVWHIAFTHPSLAQVRQGDMLPVHTLWFSDGDIAKIKKRFLEIGEYEHPRHHSRPEELPASAGQEHADTLWQADDSVDD